MRSANIPKWVYAVALVALLAQFASLVTLMAGWLQGPPRNIAVQVLVGGVVVVFVLAVYILRFHPDRVRLGPGRVGIVLLILLALVLAGLYVRSIRPLLALPYDLASWSEPMFVVDIIKWRTGAKLYLPADDSNTNTYTFAAPAISYFLASLAGYPTSIPFYRWLQQFYLLLTAIVAGLAAWQLLRLATRGQGLSHSRLWLIFFVLASFLLAVNPQTGAFNVYLHIDPMALLFSTVSFWILTSHAMSGHPRWFWLMAVMPTLGFLVKQYLVIWAVVYVVYLWLDGRYPLRRVLAFGVVSFTMVGAAVAVSLAIWGEPFLYWVFQVMGGHVVSVPWMANRFAEAAPYLVPGLFGGYVLLRGPNCERLLGIWAGWIVMILAGLYTSGITFSPTHLGPATIVGGCFALAAVVTVWSPFDSSAPPHAQQWLHMGIGFVLVATFLSALGYLRPTSYSVSSDLSRYVREIEKEFNGLPVERVLLDSGDWIYLRHNVLMKDRAPIVLTHRAPSAGLLARARNQEYARILAHRMPNGSYVYDMSIHRGTMKTVLAHYREVRHIPGVRGMENWRYYGMLMNDISVLEPIPNTQESQGERPRASAGANQ